MAETEMMPRLRGNAIGKSAEQNGYERVATLEETDEERQRRLLREKWVSHALGRDYRHYIFVLITVTIDFSNIVTCDISDAYGPSRPD